MDHISEEGNAIASVCLIFCLSVCFHTIFEVDRFLTLNFCMWISHDHSSQWIEGQGHSSRSWVQLTIDPRAVFLYLVDSLSSQAEYTVLTVGFKAEL